MIVTVTLNAAIDRTLTVPNFQRGQRHRASAGVTLAGGKGINVARALKLLGEPLVGQEFHDDEDFRVALDSVAEMGARNVLITTEQGCLALLREDRESVRYRAVAPRVDPVSTVGSGDVLLAAFIAARRGGRPGEEALRAAVAAGAASTLEVGAGRFDPRQAARLHGDVSVEELEPVAAER